MESGFELNQRGLDTQRPNAVWRGSWGAGEIAIKDVMGTTGDI